MESIESPRIARPAWPVPAMFSGLAVTSLAASGIHFSVMGEHFAEYFAFGLFFAVVAWLQALWALGIVAAPTRPLLLGGLVGNAVIVTVWIVSRTSGLPIGPEEGIAEPAAFLDVLSTVLEVGIVATVALLLVRHRPNAAGPRRSGSLLVVALGLALVILTTAAVATGSSDQTGHGEDEHSEGQEGDEPTLSRLDLGDGRVLQILVDESGGAPLMHLTFFGAEGEALEVESVTVTGVSPTGEAATIPVERFEPGHYAATLDLEGGEWEFDVEGSAVEGGPFAADFHADVP